MDLWTWHKSSYSGGNGGNCVEAQETPAAVNIRDTQHRDHGHLTFPTTEWAKLMGDLRRTHD